MKRYTLFALITSFVIGGIVAFAISYTTALGVQKSGNGEFCITCHTMTPMYESNLKEEHHGGNSNKGLKAECVDCHADHTSLYTYLRTKVTAGLHDLRVTLFEDVSKIDWKSKRKRKEEFVYDTGCLKCHSNLKDAPNQSIKQVKGHLDYFKGLTTKKCVSCHEGIGHKSLEQYLNVKNNKNNKKENN